MTRPDELIAEVLGAAGGALVGRIRLQKIFYLLQQKGMGSGFPFHYHYYGPYSRELDRALDRAQAMQGVKESIAYRQVDGMPYSTFSVRREPTSEVGNLSFGEASDLIAAMKSKSSTVLELAATIHWIVNIEHVRDWRRELLRRKGMKTEKGRTEEAIDLLKQLGLSSE